MSELQWTFLGLGLLAIGAQRFANAERGWRAWCGFISVVALAGLVALLLDSTGWAPNYVWIAAIPIALASAADMGHYQGKFAPREPSDPS